MHSPQTIAQAAVDGVAPAAVPRLPQDALRLTGQRPVAGGVEVTLRADRAGTAYLYAWDGDAALGDRTVELAAGRSATVVAPVAGGTPTALLAAFESNGSALARSLPLN
ncbi:hypothetical protein ACFY2R_24930 [Micromonospora olivasterospora]|uniref:Uncharacterized protein n=1 Tax=Micromonospora olivasterospora TaxID=1880 RepID=A0A562I4D7_MICOL|nr:hypothetical protein [Micromonospora olivasterospora]TWH65887.1 hypothetical protein JD77_00827 [Micromonospora olivasterospora]